MKAPNPGHLRDEKVDQPTSCINKCNIHLWELLIFRHCDMRKGRIIRLEKDTFLDTLLDTLLLKVELAQAVSTMMLSFWCL